MNGTDAPFELRLARSQRTVQVAAGQSAVDALEAAGVAVPTSCREGICGTCVTRVLEGTPDHRDLFLTGDEQDANNCFTPCCSRAHGGFLLIDL
jgi:vanillate O-demethylase ferredoxin subunit